MNIRSKLAAAAAALVAASALAGAGTADAAVVGNTTVTFSVGAGSLAITSGASAALSDATSVVGGSSVTGAVGATTVTDARAALAGQWNVTGTMTDFTDGAATIAKANASVYSGAATSTTGVVVFVPTLVAAPVSMAGSGGVIASATGVLGASSVTYNPTVVVTVPGNAIAGDYEGTFTQTVA